MGYATNKFCFVIWPRPSEHPLPRERIVATTLTRQKAIHSTAEFGINSARDSFAAVGNGRALERTLGSGMLTRCRKHHALHIEMLVMQHDPVLVGIRGELM